MILQRKILDFIFRNIFVVIDDFREIIQEKAKIIL